MWRQPSARPSVKGIQHSFHEKVSHSVSSTHHNPDVIVVGAGLFGLATAYHLARAGKRVTVIDSGEPATGTTKAGAGFVGLWAAGYAWYWNASERDLEQYGIDFYRSLHAQGRDIGYRQTGNLWLSVTDAGYRDHILPFDRHPLRPEGGQLLTPNQVAEHAPGVNPAAVTGGYLHPHGIQISAPDAGLALADAARELGVHVVPNHAVSGVLTENGRAIGVRTADGESLLAASVVIAAGSWTNTLLEPFGRQLPFLRVIASRLTSEPFGLGAHPTLMLPELDGLWVREHRGGLTYGNGAGYETLVQNNTPADRRPARTDLIDAMRASLAPALAALIPAGGSYTQTAEWTQGVVSYTADRRFFAGAVPEVAGLFAVAGCNESGVTHGPALGRITAGHVLSAGHGIDPAHIVGDPTRYLLDRQGGEALPDEDSVGAAMPARRAVDRAA